MVVSGLPRSGTSMAMKMLEAGGLPVVSDGLRRADEDNPRGYYEDERVKDLHQEGDKTWLRDARGKVVKIISFLLKSLPADNNYQVLFMHRNLREIVASQNKMLARRGERNDTPDERAVQLLDEQVRDARFFLRRPQFEVLELTYADVLNGPRPQAQRRHQPVRHLLLLALRPLEPVRPLVPHHLRDLAALVELADAVAGGRGARVVQQVVCRGRAGEQHQPRDNGTSGHPPQHSTASPLRSGNHTGDAGLRKSPADFFAGCAAPPALAVVAAAVQPSGFLADRHPADLADRPHRIEMPENKDLPRT